MPTQGIVDTNFCPCTVCLRVFVWKVLSGQREIILLHPCLRKKNDVKWPRGPSVLLACCWYEKGDASLSEQCLVQSA
ncbi:hypothetical protein CABS01_11448 [Colletotrichum abscissum]|uniref:uncharacterized protein n=1 Tax=Colletotrichum abscissum TaxID=1671311 RepID=UPI0027D73780|nr:uncharacterized protein CABS01_11448 [Colletotrichum abscissum]KAK1494432.1 hypothetical protein CABS01_11448 [Colletotrichum abscissum]